ncbi:MAG: phosphatidylglycerophosphatase A [Burkholderiales bacterium]|nr:phosphatidylglycerophosphatase A [Burkholderiales bacterium]
MIHHVKGSKTSSKFLFAHPAHFFALGFGAGLSPKAPGTIGTLVGFPIFWLLDLLPLPFFWPALAVLFIAGVPICEQAGRALGVADHGSIVWDEIVAFVLVLAFTPRSLPWTVGAFAVFRVFDIWKPFPIDRCDRAIKGGFGVMLDDLLAAGYAILLILAAQKLLNGAT